MRLRSLASRTRSSQGEPPAASDPRHGSGRRARRRGIAVRLDRLLSKPPAGSPLSQGFHRGQDVSLRVQRGTIPSLMDPLRGQDDCFNRYHFLPPPAANLLNSREITSDASRSRAWARASSDLRCFPPRARERADRAPAQARRSFDFCVERVLDGSTIGRAARRRVAPFLLSRAPFVEFLQAASARSRCDDARARPYVIARRAHAGMATRSTALGADPRSRRRTVLMVEHNLRWSRPVRSAHGPPAGRSRGRDYARFEN